MVKVAQIFLEQSRTRKEDWSKGLIAKAAIELADTTATAVRDDEATTADPADASNAKSADDLPIMCQGFMFHRSPTFFDCFCRHLKDKRVVNSVELSKYRPLTGAVLLSANGVDERKALKDAIELLPPDRRAIFRY
jgi:hypothetical protein